MKRKNLIVKKKINKEKSLIKNIKVKKFYIRFKKIILKNIRKDNFAVAVSGGSDSLCLAYFSKMLSNEIDNKIDILIVDHKLRKESSKEAIKVKNILKKNNIKSNILSWKGTIPIKNIQNGARNIRYALIANYCMKKKIRFLLTAHHMDDQIENFFIRLFRGSGLTGLSSMSETFDYSTNFKIIRPFLNFKKSDLGFITLQYFKTFIKDPSNENDKYLRVRVRKYRDNLEKEGLDTKKIINTVNNLFSANKALNYYKSKSLNKHVNFFSKNKCLISKNIFLEEAGEIIFKSFSEILSLISGSYYPPRSKKITSLIKRTKKSNFRKSTLGGCIIEKKDRFILISKEPIFKKRSINL